ncbi:hypothetical protein ANT2_4568 [plant metagenome]|uniref:Benenodin family lasso peptide n=1 Tax=plant metagenome TaxID=1297885 RepID=A0A484S5L6_9ZZZZ
MDVEVQDDDIIVLGAASVETQGGMAGNEGVSLGIAFLPGISEE